MRKFLILLLFSFGFLTAQAQTKEELEGLKKEKNDSIAALQSKGDALQAEIDALPGWRLKATGTIGGSFSGFNNWYAKETPNSSVGNFGFNINAYANLIQDKFFWKNSMNLNIGWVKYDDKDDDTDNENFEVATDVFNLASLYGHKISDKVAVSGLVEYRSQHTKVR